MDLLLRLPDVMRAVGLRKTAIYKRIRLREFPAPVRLAGRMGAQASAVGWNSREIEAWIRARPSTRTDQ